MEIGRTPSGNMLLLPGIRDTTYVFQLVGNYYAINSGSCLTLASSKPKLGA